MTGGVGGGLSGAGMEADSPPPLTSMVRIGFLQGGAVFFCDVDADKCPPKQWDAAMGGKAQ